MSKKRSQAWKDLERSVAVAARDVGFVRAFRVLRGDDIGISDTDVKIPEVPQAMIDCKYTERGWSHHAKFFECEKRYIVKGAGTFLILPTKGKGERGSLSTVRTEVLMDLLAKVYRKADRPADAIGCPMCPGLSIPKAFQMGLTQAVCQTCQFAFLMATTDVPAGALAAGCESGLLPAEAGEFPLEVEVEAPARVTKGPKKARTKKRAAKVVSDKRSTTTNGQYYLKEKAPKEIRSRVLPVATPTPIQKGSSRKLTA